MAWRRTQPSEKGGASGTPAVDYAAGSIEKLPGIRSGIGDYLLIAAESAPLARLGNISVYGGSVAIPPEGVISRNSPSCPNDVKPKYPISGTLPADPAGRELGG